MPKIDRAHKNYLKTEIWEETHLRETFYSTLIFQQSSMICIECFHMTSRRPYWCPKTMKRRPCWCPKPILWELNSFLMQTLSFVSINLHRCWPREWKHSIELTLRHSQSHENSPGVLLGLAFQKKKRTTLKWTWITIGMVEWSCHQSLRKGFEEETLQTIPLASPGPADIDSASDSSPVVSLPSHPLLLAPA